MLQDWGPPPQKAAVQGGLTLTRTVLLSCFSTRAELEPAPPAADVWQQSGAEGASSSPAPMLPLPPASLVPPEPRARPAGTLCQAAGPQLSTGNVEAAVGTIQYCLLGLSQS